MIRVSKVDVNWLEVGTFDGLIVHYFDGDVEGQVTLDTLEYVAMNLTLNDIRERVVLKLRGIQ